MLAKLGRQVRTVGQALSQRLQIDSSGAEVIEQPLTAGCVTGLLHQRLPVLTTLRSEPTCCPGVRGTMGVAGVTGCVQRRCCSVRSRS